MNWNPYKRIADLERRVDELLHEMLHLVANYSARLRQLERTKAKEAAAGFVNPTFGLLIPEEAQALAEKRVRQNAYARKYYAKRKAQKAGQA